LLSTEPGAAQKAGRVSVRGAVYALVAILVLINLPTFIDLIWHDTHPTQRRAYQATLASDLVHLVWWEEAYFADFGAYSATPEKGYTTPSAGRAVQGFASSAGVTIRIGAATRSGWNATAIHRLDEGVVCAVFLGDGPAPEAGAVAGEPKCRQKQTK